MLSMNVKQSLFSLLLAAMLLPNSGRGARAAAPAADPDTAAMATITSRVERPASKVPPLGVGGYGDSGAVSWAANNFVQNSGNEPVYWRNYHRVTACGDNWFEIDGGGVSWWDLWGSGFLSGADLRIYRIVDKSGKSLPINGNYPDMSAADHVALVGKTKVIPEGAPGFPDGGWLVTKYGDVNPNAWTRHGNLSVTDNSGLINGRQYWYSVVAVDAKGVESDLGPEAAATPVAGLDGGPHILTASADDLFPAVTAGNDINFEPKSVGGKAPFTWSIVDPNGRPAALPAGLALNTATGAVSGRATAAVAPDTLLVLKVADARGRSDTRRWILNLTAQATAVTKPAPPTEVKAVAGNGFVTISWRPSPSPSVAAYRLKRSVLPLAKQVNRVYVMAGSPKLELYDYVVLQRRFDPFDMKYVHSRARGIGNPMDSPAWYWQTDPASVQLSLVPHPQPLPPAMTDPGETCLQVKSAAAGPVSMRQTVFIGTEHGGESIWYGQFEPGKKYHLEVWLRQEGLADNGRVTFSYGNATRTVYSGIGTTFPVTGEWKEFTYDFTGPDRPKDDWHFGHKLTFNGPGTLWLDNFRILREDRPEDAEKPYVPNATVFDELMRSQPTDGVKGAQRCIVLSRDMTMKNLMSWHANAQVRPDWRTAISGTAEMTLPMELEWTRLTGRTASTRMVPWITIQHILHTEEEWRGFVEYMAAPYDPAKDTPQSKPWAYMRYQQRGVGTPWTDEFREIVIELGNETWHNGVFEDWLGFAMRNQVWLGGKEYGLFSRYLIEAMQQSPYWTQGKLGNKIRFALTDGYLRRDVGNKKLTYGEEAMQVCPQATILAHANYIGPKWETGDKSTGIFDDHGVQATLLAYLMGNDEDFRQLQAMRTEMAAAGHAYDIAAYEAGPSGYTLPGQGSPETVEVNERYGKSLAMGVATLDGWLGAYRHGWTHQMFSAYGQGGYWNSHTWFSNGFRPSPGWEALQMRNLARGDMMAVQMDSSPTIPFGKAIYPLIGVYAMHEGKNWFVFVLSRKLGGMHDGRDFGNGATPVTIRLPFAAAGKVTLHRLYGDPRLNNREKMALQIESRDLPPTVVAQGRLVVNDRSGGITGGMPAGSIYLYTISESR